MLIISSQWRALNAEHHRLWSAYGSKGYLWAKRVRRLAKELGTTDILDYGAGKQSLASALPMLKVRSYDPAVPGINGKPRSADLVVCTDVLEHVETPYVDTVLYHLQLLTKKMGYFVISLRPGHAVLSNGALAHTTVKSAEWWMDRLRSRWNVTVLPSRDKRLIVTVLPK